MIMRLKINMNTLWKLSAITRMHSSRMRTGRSLTVSRGVSVFGPGVGVSVFGPGGRGCLLLVLGGLLLVTGGLNLVLGVRVGVCLLSVPGGIYHHAMGHTPPCGQNDTHV